MTGLENFTAFSHNKTMRQNKNTHYTGPITFIFVFTFFLILALSPDVWAQKIKIKKVKGTTALIESSIQLEEGKTYDLKTESITLDVDYKQIGFKSRQNFITFGGSLSSLKGSDYTRNNLDLQIRYGWNFSTLEFGGVGQVRSLDVGGGATNEFSLGGFCDYNLSPNRDPKTFIYGPLALVMAGSTQYPGTQGGGSSTTLDLNLGGFFTWFFHTSSQIALRGEAYFDYSQVNTTKSQSNLMGLGSRALLVFYF